MEKDGENERGRRERGGEREREREREGERGGERERGREGERQEREREVDSLGASVPPPPASEPQTCSHLNPKREQRLFVVVVNLIK